jgi:phage terminase large subunit
MLLCVRCFHSKHAALKKFAEENPFVHCVAGVDIGGSKSATSFTLAGITRGFKHVVILDEVYDKKNLSAESVIEEFKRTMKRWKGLYPRLTECYVDSAEQLFVKSFQASGVGVSVMNARKSAINDRIYSTTRLMSQGRFLVSASCKNLIDAFDSAVWDSNAAKDERLDNGVLNVDSLDSMEYALEPYFRDLLRI